MRIDPKTTIARQPAVRVRDFLRSSGSGLWALGFVQKRLKIDLAPAQELVEELLRRGLVEQTSEYSDGPYWRMTRRGSTFSLASAAKPLRRRTAEDALSAFLQRVDKVNSIRGSYTESSRSSCLAVISPLKTALVMWTSPSP